MIPLKRAFEEKRRMAIPLAAGLAINVIVFVAVVYPMRARVHAAELREQNATAALTTAQQEDRSARGLVQGKSRTTTALRTFYRDVLPPNSAGARNITYLHLQQLAEQHHLRTLHRNFDPEPNPKGPLRRERITMAIEGNYDEIRRFIYDVETGKDFIVIDGVTLTQSGEAGGNLQLTMNLSTYYKHED